MRLISAHLRHVRQHRSLQLQFHPQLTVIGGANESGKSTVVEALHKGLFLRAGATGRGVEELRSRQSSGLPEVEIGFEAEGRPWLLRKRFSGASGTCQLSDDRGLALSGAAAEERLAALLGMERLVEGRQIGQLKERWAHLWVRQGESGSNVLEGDGDRYDLSRLVDELQGRQGGSALESPLDRALLEQLQARLDQLFTASGKVRAGSPLLVARQRQADCQERLNGAQARLADLETSMERLQAIDTRLDRIERQERPALQQRQRLTSTLQLQRAEVRSLNQEHDNLRQLLDQRRTLEAQLAAQRQETSERQALLQSVQAQVLQQDQALRIQAGEQRTLLEQIATVQQQQQLGRLWLERQRLAQEAAQLREYQQQFEQLQHQAGQLKQQLTELPALGAAEVAALRQAEQALLQAETRCQAMATGLELLAADQPVLVDGAPMAPGSSRQLSDGVELQVGSSGGVRLRIQPGGGQALAEARAQVSQGHAALAEQRRRLGVDDSDAAEGIATQRQGLETELAGLRRAAAALPWTRLKDQIAALKPRQQRLDRTLSHHQPLLEQLRAQGEEPPEQPTALEAWLDQRQEALEILGGHLARVEKELADLQRLRTEQESGLKAHHTRLDQLSGSLSSLGERLEQLTQGHGDESALAARLGQLETTLQTRQQDLERLDAELAALPRPSTANERQLEEEKDALLTQRGHHEERCQSLGASDPAAALEQCQAEAENAAADGRAIEHQARALQLLVGLFQQARRDLSQRYSDPLQLAIGTYLTHLNSDDANLDFDPQRGFVDLRLQQGAQSYGFAQLSGGMREQLSAALRLALAEVLQPAYDNCLPIIFDDAFTATDATRLAGVHQMVRHGTHQGLQVILLSCNPQDYQPLSTAGQLIVLPHPER